VVERRCGTGINWGRPEKGRTSRVVVLALQYVEGKAGLSCAAACGTIGLGQPHVLRIVKLEVSRTRVVL